MKLVKSVPMRSLTLALSGACASGVAFGQDAEALFFTTNDIGTETTLSGSFGAPMAKLNRADIAVTTPGAGAYSAEPFLTKMNTNVEFGDRDGDGSIFQVLLTYGIDALHFCQPGDARNLNLYLSVAADLPATASLPAILDGDIVSLRAGGAVKYLLREAQIAAAFNVPAGTAFGIDAFAIDPYGNIALSFDNDTPIYGGAVLAKDGDLLLIPVMGVTMGQCEVLNVVAKSGFVLLSEPVLDAMVVQSGLSDDVGVALTTIGDLDGLDPDSDGGSSTVQIVGQLPTPNDDSQNPYNGLQIQVGHWRFCGRDFDGAGVLTTVAGGQIETMNGAALGNAAPVPTTGPQVGLLASGSVRALGSLASVAKPNPPRFVLDTDDVVLTGGATFHLYWQGAKPGSAIFLGAAIHAPAGVLTGAAPASSILMNPGHCLLMSGLAIPAAPIPAGLAGAGSYSVVVPAIVPPDFEITFQAFGPLGSVPAVSSAVTVHF